MNAQSVFQSAFTKAHDFVYTGNLSKKFAVAGIALGAGCGVFLALNSDPEISTSKVIAGVIGGIAGGGFAGVLFGFLIEKGKAFTGFNNNGGPL